MKCTPMFKLLYIERYMIPHVDSMFLGQLLIVTILEAAVTFKSTFIIVNLIDYSDISSGITFTHLPSTSCRCSYAATFLFLILLVYNQEIVLCIQLESCLLKDQNLSSFFELIHALF